MYSTIVCTLSLDRIQPRPISKFGEYGEDHQVTGKKKFSTKETDENEFRSKSEKRNLVTNINFLKTFKPLLFVSGGGSLTLRTPSSPSPSTSSSTSLIESSP